MSTKHLQGIQVAQQKTDAASCLQSTKSRPGPLTSEMASNAAQPVDNNAAQPEETDRLIAGQEDKNIERLRGQLRPSEQMDFEANKSVVVLDHIHGKKTEVGKSERFNWKQ